MKNERDNDVLATQDLNLLAESIPALSPSDSAKARMRAGIKQRLTDDCPAGGITTRTSAAEWFALNDKISVKVLHQDHEKRVQTALWRLQPGAVITAHRHENDEDCLVLEGSIRVGQHLLKQGDFHKMEKGSFHSDLHSEEGALLYLKHDMHDRLMGPTAG